VVSRTIDLVRYRKVIVRPLFPPDTWTGTSTRWENHGRQKARRSSGCRPDRRHAARRGIRHGANASTPAATPDINGYFTGTGSTLAIAEQNALYTSAEYGCSGTGTLVSSSESAGVWTAVMKSYCSWYSDAARPVCCVPQQVTWLAVQGGAQSRQGAGHAPIGKQAVQVHLDHTVPCRSSAIRLPARTIRANVSATTPASTGTTTAPGNGTASAKES
jgi:hypothetical protein